MPAWLPLLGNSFCLLVSGAIIGWLVGLSASPTVQVVITSILAIVGGLVGALAEIKRPEVAGEASPRGENAETAGPVSVPAENATAPVGAPTAATVSLEAATPVLMAVAPAPVAVASSPVAPKLSPVPLTLLLVGLFFGSLLGLRARTHDRFGAEPQPLINKWKATGLKDEEIARRLFDQLYPPLSPTERKYEEKVLVEDPKTLVKRWTSKDFGLKKEVVARRLFDEVYPTAAPTGESKSGEKPKSATEASATASVLHGILFSNVPADVCTDLQYVKGPDLRKKIDDLKDDYPELKQFAADCKSDAILEAAVKDLVCSGKALTLRCVLLLGMLCLPLACLAEHPNVFLITAAQCRNDPKGRALTGFRLRGIVSVDGKPLQGIVTALHGVFDSGRITVTAADFKLKDHVVILRAVDIVHDLALLSNAELDAQNVGYSKGTASSLHANTPVMVIGYPLRLNLKDLSIRMNVGEPPTEFLKNITNP